MREHGEAVEADLALRGVDLRDLWRPGRKLTWRRLRVLISALPQDSATATILRDEAPEPVPAEVPAGFGRWSHEAMLLAALIDAVNALRYENVRIAGAKDVPRPDPVPRPGVGAKVRPINRAARDYLDGLRAVGG